MDNTENPSPNVLVFSLAMNGYQWVYRRFIASHKAYAKRHDYHYQLINQPAFSLQGKECCWIKLSVMLAAIQQDYDYVVFFDADALVSESAPDIRRFVEPDKGVYMVKGYSGRFNSGVIVVDNSSNAQQWLQQIINAKDRPIPELDSVGWGENGHIIHYSKQCHFIKELDIKWNNTHNPRLNDHVRHYNIGPLVKPFDIRLKLTLLKLVLPLLLLICRLFLSSTPDLSKTLTK